MQRYHSNSILETVLQRANVEELKSLTKIVDKDATQPSAPKALQISICKEAGHGVGNWLRGEGISYRELLHDACSILKVDNLAPAYKELRAGLSPESIDSTTSARGKAISERDRAKLVNEYVDHHERMLLAKLLVVVYEKMTPEQRRNVDKQVAAISENLNGKDLKGLSTSATLLVLGNLGGFATYTLMSTLLSALSLGTLGFGAYTFASSALSFVLGPVGWLGLGVYGVIKLGGPNEQKVVQLAATCAMIDQRLKSAR